MRKCEFPHVEIHAESCITACGYTQGAVYFCMCKFTVLFEFPHVEKCISAFACTQGTVNYCMRWIPSWGKVYFRLCRFTKGSVNYRLSKYTKFCVNPQKREFAFPQSQDSVFPHVDIHRKLWISQLLEIHIFLWISTWGNSSGKVYLLM